MPNNRLLAYTHDAQGYEVPICYNYWLPTHPNPRSYATRRDHREDGLGWVVNAFIEGPLDLDYVTWKILRTVAFWHKFYKIFVSRSILSLTRNAHI